MELDNFNPNIKFTYEFSEESVSSVDLNVNFSNGKLQSSLYVEAHRLPSIPSLSMKPSQTYQKVNSMQLNTKSQQGTFSRRRLQELLQPNKIMVHEAQLSRALNECPEVMVSFRNVCKLSNYLVRVKFYLFHQSRI